MAVTKVICKNVKNNPHCPHGPTLKFVKVQDGSEQVFFACSTYRDRKDCRFYLAATDSLTDEKRCVWALEAAGLRPSMDHAAACHRLEEVRRAGARERLYCHTCCQLDLAARAEQHRHHDVQTSVSDHLLSHPSQMLKPKEGSKKEAQYLFASSTTQVIVENLQRAGVSRVLCLGTPRVHEHIQASGLLQSLLLDMDSRHQSFWSPEQFVWYNMFNRHIMSECQDEPRRVLRQFVSAQGELALVMDPPFGGHVDPLAATLRHFSKLVEKTGRTLRVIWIFPYFRERHILEKCPSLVMSDYKVQYDNHKEFHNGGGGRKLGSPVRLFTDLDPRLFELPQAEGYRLCGPCGRWVAAENKHCRKCNTCPSKDGRTYVHCELCKACVKPQWQHCLTCLRCLPSHQCHQETNGQGSENVQPRHKRMRTLKVKAESKLGRKMFKTKQKKRKNIKSSK